jgi:hypothetical protein
MLKLIETELSSARNKASHPDDGVLRYLIDMAIQEARSKGRSRGPGTDDATDFAGGIRRPEQKRVS